MCFHVVCVFVWFHKRVCVCVFFVTEWLLVFGRANKRNTNLHPNPMHTIPCTPPHTPQHTPPLSSQKHNSTVAVWGSNTQPTLTWPLSQRRSFSCCSLLSLLPTVSLLDGFECRLFNDDLVCTQNVIHTQTSHCVKLCVGGGVEAVCVGVR